MFPSRAFGTLEMWDTTEMPRRYYYFHEQGCSCDVGWKKLIDSERRNEEHGESPEQPKATVSAAVANEVFSYDGVLMSWCFFVNWWMA